MEIALFKQNNHQYIFLLVRNNQFVNFSGKRGYTTSGIVKRRDNLDYY